jgi:hypothetical protein
MRSPASEISRICPALPATGERLKHPFREGLHSGLECRVFLTHNFVEVRSAHPCLLKLLERPPGLDALVLTRIPNQKHSVMRLDRRLHYGGQI